MANITEVKEEKLGIGWCLNCVGYHPEHMPDMRDFAKRLTNPQKDAWHQHATFLDKAAQYRNKSCALCGRSYDHDGKLDETWSITAKRVKEELQRAGIFGTDDKKVELVVARCRKSVQFLFENRFKINPKEWEKFTFAGTLALIITHAIESRSTRNIADIKGPVR